MPVGKISIWVSAFRPRTLPLAVASILLGSFLAAADGAFKWSVAGLCILTAVLLQVLSNLANDYGDSIHGADNRDRSGPQRAVQSGKISPKVMLKALGLFAFMCLAIGYLLIKDENILYYFLGLAAILAAISYTAGPKPYGYAGLGDLFVFMFFGIVGVLGTYYLHTHRLNTLVILPAISCGLLSVAVLNINNMRDIYSDKLAGKITIPVRIGESKAKLYHLALLVVALTSALLYVSLDYRTPWQLLFLLTLPMILKNAIGISSTVGRIELDPYLRQMSLTTLVFSLSFGLGNLL